MVWAIIKSIIQYGVIAPLYTLFRWLIPIFVIFGLPIFIAGMLVATIGVMGHVFFIILFTIAMMYYFKFAYSVLYPGKKSKKPVVKKNTRQSRKFTTSLGKSRQQTNYLPSYGYLSRYGYSPSYSY